MKREILLNPQENFINVPYILVLDNDLPEFYSSFQIRIDDEFLMYTIPDKDSIWVKSYDINLRLRKVRE